MPDIPPTTSAGMLDDEALYEQQYGDGEQRHAAFIKQNNEGAVEYANDNGDIEAALERGECPWCEEYEGEHVNRHAPKAHAEEWSEYRDG